MTSKEDSQDDTEFDSKKFNSEFDKKKEMDKQNSKMLADQRLNKMNSTTTSKPLYQYTMGEIFIGIKDTWFGIIDDLLLQKFTLDTLTKESRLFFIGLTLLIVGIVFYLYNYLVDEDDEPMPREKIVEIRHVVNNKYGKEFNDMQMYQAPAVSENITSVEE
jgi:hypothetical protein